MIKFELVPQGGIPVSPSFFYKWKDDIVKARPSDPSQPTRQDAYFRVLKAFIPEIEIIYGMYKEHSVMLPRADEKGFIRVLKSEEKGSDVNLAVHLLHDAWLDKYQRSCGQHDPWI